MIAIYLSISQYKPLLWCSFMTVLTSLTMVFICTYRAISENNPTGGDRQLKIKFLRVCVGANDAFYSGGALQLIEISKWYP